MQRFDTFLRQADKDINFYEAKILPDIKIDRGRKDDLGLGNPYNPYQLNSEFKVNILEDAEYMKMKDEIKKENGANKIPFDSDMVVFEGCERDDKIVLGGRNAFLSHFCTFFNFSICSSPQDSKML